MGDAAPLGGYRHVEVASVSDAREKITGLRMHMSHRMRPIFPSTFAGIALTVKLKNEENRDPDALQGMLAAIDQGGPNSVELMVVEDGSDIAGMGGLRGTAMASRNFPERSLTAACAMSLTCRKSVSRCLAKGSCLPLLSATIASRVRTFLWYVMVLR